MFSICKILLSSETLCRWCSLRARVLSLFMFQKSFILCFCQCRLFFFLFFFFTALFSCCKNKEKFTEPYVQIFANPFARLVALFRSSCSSPPTFYSLVSSTSVLSRRSFSVINDGVSRTSFFFVSWSPWHRQAHPLSFFPR